MDFQLQSKAQAFVLLDAFESDLRACLSNFVADHLNYSTILGQEFSEVRSRAAADDRADEEDLGQYLYFRQVYDLLLRFKSEIPRDLGDELSDNVGSLHYLVAVRNRVMHGRPLEIDDLESVAGILTRFASRHFELSRSTRDHLIKEPLWEPPYSPEAVRQEKVLHNLPMADFDETGLVGRGSESVAIKKLVEGKRDRIVTITGEGGIGKTALALQIAYSIVDDPDPTFDCVLWVSLKNEILTADGVRALANAVQDIAGASLTIGQVLDSSFRGTIADLSEYLEGLTALIVIDNLESAQGTEVLELYDALPASTSYLFTSRVGLGQVERRYPLGGLDTSSAVLLLRKFASRRQVRDLAASPLPQLEKTVAELRHSPLAVRWYVLSVEAGKTPADTIRNQGELLRFCVDNVYEALEPNARLLLVILRSLDRPISFDELAVIAELPIDELRASSQALSRGSLVVRQAPTEEEGEKLQISATARAYLPRVDYSSPVLSGVSARESAYLADREKQTLEAQTRRLDANMIHIRHSEDQPTAHLLRLALRFGKTGDFDRASAQIERARGLNPEFFEVDRVAAFTYANQRDLYRADLTYRSALALAKADNEKAVVAYFFAGFLARQQHDLEAALRFAEQAHRALDFHDTALLLGNILVWSRRFTEGQEQLEHALEAPSSKMKRIATTSIIESWRRWAEYAIESTNPSDGLNKGLAGASVGRQMISTGVQDEKLATSALLSLHQALRAMERMTDVHDPGFSKVARELDFVTEWYSLFRTSSGWPRFHSQLNRVAHMFGRSASSSENVQRLTSAEKPPTRALGPASGGVETSLVLRGRVKSLLDKYGFLAHPEYPDGIFFHFGGLAPGVLRTKLEVGQPVEFELTLGPDSRPRATHVAPLLKS